MKSKKKYILIALSLLLILSIFLNIYLDKQIDRLSELNELHSKKISSLLKQVENFEQFNEIFQNKISKYKSDFEFDIDFKDNVHSLEWFINVNDSILKNNEIELKNSLISYNNLQKNFIELQEINLAFTNDINQLKIEFTDYKNKNEILLNQQISLSIILDSLKKIIPDTLLIPLDESNYLFYYGQIDDSLPKGNGVGLYLGKGSYFGSWNGKKRHGFGTHFYKNEDVFVGTFVDDKRHGQGTYLWKNKEIYIGEWKDDKRHGQGVIKDKNGKIKYQGEWKDDTFVGKELGN